MSSTPLFHLTVSQASRMIQRRELSPVELVDAFLDRISAVDDKVRSYLLITADRARAQALQAQRDIAAGRYLGPLHGIPYAVKDNYYTRGLRTTAASRLLLDFVPDHDATAVRKLDAAGAIMLGKLNTWEYGTGNGGVYFDLPFEPARNPWDLSRFTGGSSTGAGAAVAAGTAMIALGSDTTGSVRLPAAACGLQGMKPTYGRVSRHGILPNCYTMDTPGPLTWTVEDSAIVLGVIAGRDSRDPASADRAVPDYLDGLNDGVAGMTVGVVRDVGAPPGAMDDANAAGLENMVEVLRGAGARIVDVVLPAPIAEYRNVTSVINWTESLSIHEEDFVHRASDMGYALRDKLMSGAMTRAVDYVAAQRRRRELADATDALVRSVDVLIAPCAFRVAPAFADDAAMRAYTRENACPPFNASGHPAMTVCTGYDAAGLPTNAQIVGRRFDEARVFQVARAYEQATPWRDRRPLL
ncbi:MAG TPA: amidase [Bordetella sp.]|jgi:aspartyl-tRNA(Asn)/glutamyl-tRNA(Gln) amidotransferase subunit A|nr:amidase [Bordetella sp.]